MLRQKFLFKPEEWSQQHEQAFKSIMRKSHSVNSMAKTRRFRELERCLPPDKTNIDKKWRYDLHSPWVNDLDFNDSQYYSFNLDSPKSPKRPKHISNIRLSTREEPQEIDPEAALEQERRRLTGIKGTISEHTLRTKAGLVSSLRSFEDAKKGYELIYQWERSKTALDKDSATLAGHIIKDLHGDMKQLTKARYAYLSAKIAKQRATAHLSKQLLLEAEGKRKALRKRQEELMRDVAKARNRLAVVYGRSYLQPRRRLIVNTAHALGSPLFLRDMVALGFLPQHWEPKPQRPKLTTDPEVVLQYTQASSGHLSRLNGLEESGGERNSPKREREARRQRSAILIQKWYKGAKVRKHTALYKHAATKIKRWYRRRVQLRAILAYISQAHALKPRKVIQRVLNECKDSVPRKRTVIPSKPSNLPPSVAFSIQDLTYSPTYEACKALQSSARDLPLAIKPHTQPAQPRPLPCIPDLPSMSLPGTGSPRTPNYHRAKATLTLSGDEAAVALHRINDLRKAILAARLDMWRYFLCTVSRKAVTEGELAGLLAKDSLYARRKMQSGSETLVWEGSQIRLNLNEPLDELDLRKVTPQTVSNT